MEGNGAAPSMLAKRRELYAAKAKKRRDLKLAQRDELVKATPDFAFSSSMTFE
jgi:hypothetical protein